MLADSPLGLLPAPAESRMPDVHARDALQLFSVGAAFQELESGGLAFNFEFCVNMASMRENSRKSSVSTGPTPPPSRRSASAAAAA